MTKKEANVKVEEARGYAVAVMKLLTVALPMRAAYELGIPALSSDEIAALLLVAASVGLGIYWLNRK